MKEDLIKKGEQNMEEARRYEFIKLLAGDIANEFNNILTTILGNINLVMLSQEFEERIFEKLNEIEKAVLRAKLLTQQLLTFLKGISSFKRPISLSDVTRDAVDSALSGSSIRYTLSMPQMVYPVEADEAQMRYTINTFVTHMARAMNSGGEIRVSVENVVPNRRDITGARRYIRISMYSDAEDGLRKDLMEIKKAFPLPKDDEKGFALTVSYSVVKGHNGYIDTDSPEGIHIYMPVMEETESTAVTEGKGTPTYMCREKILIMDDEETIRSLAGEFLSPFGHCVVCASNGSEAIELYKKAMEKGEPFDVVVVDLNIRAGMSGKETIKRLLEVDPNVRAIVSSGFISDPVMTDCRTYGFRRAIAKPYNMAELHKVIHSIVD